MREVTLRRIVARAAAGSPALRQTLGAAGVTPESFTLADLSCIPLLKKESLPGLQGDDPPWGGWLARPITDVRRIFVSPGPIYEPEGRTPDYWGFARALFAAGFRRGDVVLNTFSYHLTPGGFIFDSSARALGCAVIPAGPGNTEAQFELIEAYRPIGYSGTPDFLKILLDAATSAGRDISSIKRALVSGAAFPKSLQDEIRSRGVDACQAFGTAALGLTAF